MWQDPKYFTEEQFSGMHVCISVTKTHNLIDSSGQKLHHSFTAFRDLPLYRELRDTCFDGVITAPEGLGRAYLKTLVHSGVMGAEHLQDRQGSARLVLTDITMLGGTDLKGLPFKSRRVYLEGLVPMFLDRGSVPKVMISDVIKTDKREFFDFICRQGARGVLLKDREALYGSQVWKITNHKLGQGPGNVTLNKDWQSLQKKAEPLDEFDFDSFLAVQLLNRPDQEKILIS